MRINLPVTQKNHEFSPGELLVSTTNTKGEITHCNPAFVRVSGYSYDELMDQSHNLVRHPDMPAAAFKDMWRTIAHGFPWTGVVKNRRKDGDHYWVRANVTPIMENGKPSGYMSVRSKPDAAAVREAEALYARMRAEEAAGRATLRLRGGEVRQLGWRGLPNQWQDLGLTARMALMLVVVAVLALLPDLLGWTGPLAWGTRALVLALGGVWVLWRFHSRCATGLEAAQRFAADLAGCNLLTQPDPRHVGASGAVGTLLRRMQQIQINLRAVLGDLLHDARGFVDNAQETAHGSADLAARTESQASQLQQTAATLEQLAGTVTQTAETAQHMAVESEQSTQVANRSGAAIGEVGAAMERIRGSSTRMREIIGVIESIAFQTNLLALNAAVEAARAGEQGRGFAVVAGEVRALAQRSAASAKEIGTLINSTVDGINDGNARMAQAGDTIQGMVEAVDRVGGLVREISLATRSQSAGIAQVNAAVVELDRATQQNAAMAEQSAASAVSLGGRAQMLRRSVAVFKLE
ncbi:MAG: methyl-accepting chemotaxis protein [Comamonas sp.]